MKKSLKLFYFIWISVSFNYVYAQTTTLLTYDANGNRISKQVRGSSPNPTVTASPEAVAPSQPSTLAASGCTGGSIQWQPGNLTGSQIVVNPTATTQYTAQCVVAGCTNNGFARTTVSIIQCETIPITAVPSVNTVKYGQSVTLFAFGCVNGTVKWSSGQVGSPINVSMYGSSQVFTATCSRDYCPNLGSATLIVGGISGCLTGDVLITIKDGSWNDPATWACGRLPTSNDVVYVNHQVTVYGFAGYAKSIVKGNGGTLYYDNLGTIYIPQN